MKITPRRLGCSQNSRHLNMKNINSLFKKVSDKENIEFGIVAIMVMGVLALITKHSYYLVVIIVLSLVTLTVPVLFYPFTIVWFGISRMLGAISSRLMLTVIFFLVVTPVGVFRRIAGRDSMKLRQFSKGKESVMVVRDHNYLPEDLEHTF